MKKLALLSLLAVALFVPQQSHATFNWGKWTAIGVGVIGVSYIGYTIYSSFYSSKKEQTNILDRNNNEFNLEEYNNQKKETKNMLFSKKTFTLQEYAEKVKELIDRKHTFSLERLLSILDEKSLTNIILNKTKLTTKSNEEKTITEIVKGTWAEEYIKNYFKNQKPKNDTQNIPLLFYEKMQNERERQLSDSVDNEKKLTNKVVNNKDIFAIAKGTWAEEIINVWNEKRILQEIQE